MKPSILCPLWRPLDWAHTKVSSFDEADWCVTCVLGGFWTASSCVLHWGGGGHPGPLPLWGAILVVPLGVTLIVLACWGFLSLGLLIGQGWDSLGAFLKARAVQCQIDEAAQDEASLVQSPPLESAPGVFTSVLSPFPPSRP